jgi:hypothetical protein
MRCSIFPSCSELFRLKFSGSCFLLSHERYPIPHIARLYQVDPRRVSAWAANCGGQ